MSNLNIDINTALLVLLVAMMFYSLNKENFACTRKNGVAIGCNNTGGFSIS